jgi:translation initiation factor 5
VNGSHDATKLQDLLDGFIRKFVLCPECDNPETTLTVNQKKSTINQACKACGYHEPLEFNHKLNTFIIKNPPNLNPAAQGSSLTEGKRGKRSKKTNGLYAEVPL